ncbi:unnamed protein product [Acanthoscelides obtectus]|uniref:Uncharacterized protein n=1 Tax=Acanthoscelides obtectus TaxID=200917 RepID=A0A9P0NZR0_ACAOB|nr:unnamed protein product [Acanthoscelides obtectus]CAK1657020.1 hypothetical protein AOBTE_LOCUS20070 [Acanthoscelides obtectus]
MSSQPTGDASAMASSAGKSQYSSSYHSSSGTTHKSKHRSRSTTRHHHTSADKPKKKRHISATNSFASIPGAIKLSMLNSGLLPTSRFNDSRILREL